jgi:hypothetical protein
MNAKINSVKINNGNALTTKIRKGLSGNHNESALKSKVGKGR